ncbi:YjbE family putative metal transport protein [Heliobacterium gestii]|uniref:YjbE family putative metal transport protein n=1 Tax=Heliomicrobium gestii TaxID=2699 RepID=A0A845L9U0_HELGE|nr:TerC family protein [Heliomicrobium gestii]MBM7866925.1 YjbE family integral membrane protein [Heliomicrobium gestii]MZP42351.1 YjbE family putative metal transport protein [Heliomicrobium gestii]
MTWQTILTLLNIVFINLLLSGDNAVVIAMATMGLPDRIRRKAIFWGTSGYFVLLLLLTSVAALLIQIPMFQFVGGALLAWIALKLLITDEDASEQEESSADLKKAIYTIIWAALLMSTDNVLAIAGAAKGDLVLLFIGLGVSIPIVMVGSTLLATVMRKYPWLVYVGSGILAWTSGTMIIEDQYVASFLHGWQATVQLPEIFIPAILTVIVITIGKTYRDAVGALSK